MLSPKEMKSLYEQGANISATRREELGLEHNSSDVIELSYDLQTGSYIRAVREGGLAQHKREYSAEIAREILSLCTPESVLEVGVGEATTLLGVAEGLGVEPNLFGFDLSWSRAAYAKGWLETHGRGDCWIGTGDMFHMPFLDDSIDVVYTSHSVEPNGGQEEPILRELMRVARCYLVLLEPAYELAGTEIRQRMDSHGYCRDLPGTAERLGYRVARHDLFPFSANPMNPTAITIVEKPASGITERPASPFACPKYQTPLREIDGLFFSEEGLVVYPTIGGIPCLRIENGILASKYGDAALASRRF